MRELTDAEARTCFETYKHIEQLRRLLHIMQRELMDREEAHDQSKLGELEIETFTKATPKLRTITYGSKEYEAQRLEMAPALRHHYENNRHHPEHFAGGVDGMNLIDVLEMICDWKASTLRHDDGDIQKSIDLGKDRFNLSPQLVSILENTVRDFF